MLTTNSLGSPCSHNSSAPPPALAAADGAWQCGPSSQVWPLGTMQRKEACGERGLPGVLGKYGCPRLKLSPWYQRLDERTRSKIIHNHRWDEHVSTLTRQELFHLESGDHDLTALQAEG